MEVEVMGYEVTIGRPIEPSVTMKRSLLSRHLKPLGKFFSLKRSVTSGKKNTMETTKGGKADRRKSGSTSDMPTNYDSCDDPSQDHRTEPTTSVESILGFSFASRNTNRQTRRGISMVPALWNHDLPRTRSTSSALARAHPSTRSSCQNEWDNTQVHDGSLLLHRIASHQASRHRSRWDDIDGFEEGIELVLDGPHELNEVSVDYLERKGSASLSKTDPHVCNNPDKHPAIHENTQTQHSCERETQPARKVPSPVQQDNGDVVQRPQPKISVTTTSFSLEDHPRLETAAPAKAEGESNGWLEHEDLEAADNRPLKEIVFLSNDDQFDDMDDLTLPPAGFAPPYPPTAKMALYSRPIAEVGPSNAERSLRKTLLPPPLASPSATSRKKGDPSYEETMFASFVEERHGSFRRDSLTRLSPTFNNGQITERKCHLERNHEERAVVAERSSPTKSLAQSIDTEDDIEVIGINSPKTFEATTSGHINPMPSTPRGEISHQSGSSPGRGSVQGKGGGRDSRASRFSSLFSLLDSGTLQASTDHEEPQQKQKLPSAAEAAVPERVLSPHEYALQFFGRVYRKAEDGPPAVITSPEPDKTADGGKTNASQQVAISDRKAAPEATNLVKPIAVTSDEAPPSVIWNVDASASVHSATSGNYSASRGSQTYSGDSLTRDSLMEMLDLQAAADGDIRSARWLARRESKRKDFLFHRTLSDDSSLSGTVTSLNRSTPVLKTFECGALANMYTTSMEEESFASASKGDNIITELKADLLSTVDELKREGSFVVSKFIRQLSNQK